MASNNEEKINIIVRQTDYNRDIAEEKLKLHNSNIENVIKEYMEIEKQVETKSLSVNQMIFKEIRDLMDDAAENYKKSKEKNEKNEN